MCNATDLDPPGRPLLESTILMTRAIDRYRLKAVGLQYVSMPEGARLLSVHTRGRQPYIVAEVDLDAERAEYLIRTYLSGELLDADDQIYVGTYGLPGRKPLYHVYHILEAPPVEPESEPVASESPNVTGSPGADVAP